MKFELIRLFFNFLNNEKVIYVVLGNVNQINKQLNSDIDIAVDADSYKRILPIISKFLKDNDLVLVNLFQHEISASYIVIGKINKGSTIETIALDFCSDFIRNSRVLISFEELSNNAKMITYANMNFKIPNYSISFKYYLLKKIEKGTINKVSFDYLMELWALDKNDIIRVISEVLPKDLFITLDMAFSLNQQVMLDNKFIESCQLHLEGKYKIKFWNHFLEFKRRVNRIISPTGLIIAVYGCDGSGKSTVINELLTQLPEMDVFRGAKYHHLYAKDSGNSNKAVVSNPHEFKSRSWLMSNLKLLFFLYKYCFSFLKIVYLQKVRSQLVVFDRYYYDILVDPVRYRHKGSKWFTLLVGRLIPKPDLSFILDASEDILRARKEEVSHEETIRQRREYINLANSISNCTVIDNSSQIEFAVNDIKTVILNFLSKRYQDKYST